MAKKFLLVLISIAMAISLSGCSSAKKTTGSSKITLYWWRPNTDAGTETLEEVKADFESEHTSVKIEIVTKDIRTYYEEIDAALKAHSTVENAPDIISLPAENLPAWTTALEPAPDDLLESDLDAKKKTGKTTDELVAEQFEPSVAKAVTFNSSDGTKKVYGLPMAVDNLALYINTSLTEKAAENMAAQSKGKVSNEEIKALRAKITAAPKTWQDVVEIAPYLTIKNGETLSQASIAMGTADNVERSYDILTAIMMQNGTKLTSDDLSAATFNQTQTSSVGSVNPGEQALKFYLRFANTSDPLYGWNNDISDSSLNAFINGQTAMMIHYASAYSTIINKAPALKSSIDVAALPQIVDPTIPTNASKLKTTAKAWVEAAPNAKSDTRRRVTAWQFIKSITSKSGSASYLSAMMLPSALKGQAGKAKFEAFANQKTYADVWYKGSQPDEVDTAFISMIAQARSGSFLKDVLDKSNSDISTILQKSLAKWATAASTTNLSTENEN